MSGWNAKTGETQPSPTQLTRWARTNDETVINARLSASGVQFEWRMSGRSGPFLFARCCPCRLWTVLSGLPSSPGCHAGSACDVGNGR